MSAVDQSQGTAERLGSLLEFETLVADLSSRFINLPPGEVDHEIEDALRRVCDLLGLDFAVLWQWSASAPGVIMPTHAYPAQNRPQPEPRVQEQYPWSVRQMLAGRTITFSSLNAPSSRTTDFGTSAAFPRTCGRGWRPSTSGSRTCTPTTANA